jgi:integrase
MARTTISFTRQGMAMRSSGPVDGSRGRMLCKARTRGIAQGKCQRPRHRRARELRGLRWRDVNFADKLVHVRRSYTGAGEGPPKSGNARSVPLIDTAARALDGLSRRECFTGADDRVFCSPTGGVLDEGQIRDMFYATLELASIDRDRGTGKLLVFHDLRHTFGTLAVQTFPLSDVRAYMGHANIATTMVYVHHTPQHGAADRLEQLVSGERVPAGTQLTESDVI